MAHIVYATLNFIFIKSIIILRGLHKFFTEPRKSWLGECSVGE